MCHLSPVVAQFIPREILLACDFSHGEKWDKGVSAQLPGQCGMLPKRPTCFRILRAVAWLVGRKRLGEQQPGHLACIKETGILLTKFWTPLGSLALSHWGCHIWRSFKGSKGDPEALHASPTHFSSQWPASCMHWRQDFVDDCRVCAESWSNSGTGRKHMNLSIQHCLRESKQKTIGTKPGFAG